MTAILELWNRTSGCYILNTQGVPTFRSLKLASQFSKRYEQAEWIGGWVGMRLRGYWRSSPTNWPGIIVIANPFAKTSAAACRCENGVAIVDYSVQSMENGTRVPEIKAGGCAWSSPFMPSRPVRPAVLRSLDAQSFARIPPTVAALPEPSSHKPDALPCCCGLKPVARTVPGSRKFW